MGSSQKKGDRSSCHALFDSEQSSGNARFKTPNSVGHSQIAWATCAPRRDGAAIASKKLRS